MSLIGKGYIIEYGGDLRLTPRQRDLLKQSWLAKEAGDYGRCDDLRGRAIKLGGIKKVSYRQDGRVWVFMDDDREATERHAKEFAAQMMGRIPTPCDMDEQHCRNLAIIERNAQAFKARYMDYHE